MDRFDWEVVLSAKTEHFDTAEKALTSVSNLIEQVGSKGSISDKNVARLVSTLDKMRDTAGVKGQVTAWTKLEKEIKSTQKALTGFMQDAAGAGSKTPFQDVKDLISDSDIDKFESAEQAKTDALKVASADRKNARKQEARDKAAAEKEAVAQGNAQLKLEADQRTEFLRRRAQSERAATEQGNAQLKLEAQQVDQFYRRRDKAQRDSTAQGNAQLKLEAAQVAEFNRRKAQSQRESIAQGNAQLKLEAQQVEGLLAFRKRLAAEEAKVASEKSGRGYANASVLSDAAIDARRRESQEFSKGLQARLQGEAQIQAAADKSARANAGLTDSIIAQRYAQYDLGRTLLTTSAALTAAGAGMVTAFASQERAFADVLRTAESDATGLQAVLRDLSTQMPISFNDLSGVATLGNQLGVASEDIAAFTETVASFSTITGITYDQASQALGKIGNLMGVAADDYDRLASSISYVGRTTAATEPQIISIAQELAPAAAAAGFTADQVVGLSGALGSLKVPPERSRSTILQFFEALNTSVANGGEELDLFAQAVGVTSSELESMVRSGQGSDILSRFVNRAATNDTVEMTRALQELGLAGLRTNPTIRALAGNTELLNKAYADSAGAWRENTELQYQMAIIMETLSAKWQVFLNSAMNLAATLGSALAPAFKIVLEAATATLTMLTDFASSDAGQMFTRLAATVGIAAAAFAGIRGVIAIATGSVLAMRAALGGITSVGIMNGLKGLATALGFTGVAAGTATGGVSRLTLAIKALGRATIIGAAFQALAELIFNFGGSMEWVGNKTVSVANWIADALEGLARTVGRVFPMLGVSLGGTAAHVRNTSKEVGKWITDMGAKVGGSTKSAGASVSDFSGDLEALLKRLGEMPEGDDDPFRGLGGGAEQAAEQVEGLEEKLVSVKDYANDLKEVLSRTFELNFGVSQGEDEITKMWRDIKKASEEANQKISDYKLRLQELKATGKSLQSERDIKNYWLSIALEYGDTKRANALRAEIAKLDGDIAKNQKDVTSTNKDLSKAQQDASKSLTGNSDAALRNREALQKLIEKYGDQIVRLAESGLSQSELSEKTNILKKDFEKQAEALGFNKDRVKDLSKVFADYKIVVDKVPRNVSTKLEVKGMNPALAAIKEFANKSVNDLNRVKNAANNAKGALGTLGSNPIPTAALADSVSRYGEITETYAKIRHFEFKVRTTPPNSRNFAELESYRGHLRHLYLRAAQLRGYADGGFTGPGGKNEAAGVVHRGEYVIPKRDVNQSTGLPYADALGRHMGGARGVYASRGGISGGGGASTVALTAGTIQAIAHAVRPMLKIGDDVIAGAATSSFSHSAAVGAY